MKLDVPAFWQKAPPPWLGSDASPAEKLSKKQQPLTVNTPEFW